MQTGARREPAAVTAAHEPTGTVDDAVIRATKLLEAEPALAAEQAQEILNAVPNYPPALLIRAVSHRRTGKLDTALRELESLVQSQQVWAAAHFEYGLALADAGRGDDAIAALRRTVELKPTHTDAWRILADHLLASGDSAGGDAAYARHIQCSTGNPVLQESAAAMLRNDLQSAERQLKSCLKQAPTDVTAMRMLAEVAVRCGRNEDAKALLQRCLELAPGFAAARYNYAVLLHRTNDSQAAMLEMERLLADEPDKPSYRNLYAVILSRVGEYARSSAIYARLLDEYPGNAKVWLSYGHVLKTEGRQADCIDAYRQSLERNSAFGEAYWSLANLKTFRFSGAELDTMEARLKDPALADEDRWHILFALGKAAEDAGDFAASFQHYASGNEAYRAHHGYDADLNTKRSQRLRQAFSRQFFSEREGMGDPAQDPIFIVGMPRSGSTLLEQILSSHSAVEGTTELPDLLSMAKELRAEAAGDDIAAYAGVLASKSADELRALGSQYIERTRIHRKTDRPLFIDKMPNNFLHTGMISVLLPNAKIIDARRHPLACCFSNFKQYYARGQNFSYDLTDMGRFYRDYVELMAHFDAVLPGRVHRVYYEDTVADTESEIRRLLDYCGLEFEAGCLRFFENERPVRTASSEQVRQPIYRDGVEQWRNYEAWLEPLKAALGPVFDDYPAVPPFPVSPQ